MDIAKKEFKALLRKPMESVGFTYAGNTFYRHINDVLQTMTLRKTFCTLELHFGIFPICIPISGYLPCGILYQIAYYEGTHPRPFSHCYDQENIHIIMEQGLDVVFREVIPVFQAGTDSKSAYTTVVEAQKRMFCGTPDGVFWQDASLKWMALKNGNYEQAYIHQIAHIARGMRLIYADTKITDLLEPKLRKKLETILAEDPAWLVERKEFLHRIIQHDDAYFQELIEKNERTTLEFLQQARRSPCKYGKGDHLLF